MILSPHSRNYEDVRMGVVCVALLALACTTVQMSMAGDVGVLLVGTARGKGIDRL